jgi:hypothetical protein
MKQLTTTKMPEIIHKDIEDILTHIEFRYLEYNMYFDEEDIDTYIKTKRVLNWWNKGELSEPTNDNE